MDIQTIASQITRIESDLSTVKQAVIAYAQANAGGGAIKLPSEAPPNPLYEMDANKLLVHVRQVGNARVDPVVGADCPNTVTLPKTGHTLSIPRPDLGEMFIGYCTRVCDQATNGKGDQFVGTVGALFLGCDGYFTLSGGTYSADGKDWPAAADCFYNQRAYMSAEEKAKDDAAKAGWDAWDVKFKQQAEEAAAKQKADAAAYKAEHDRPQPDVPTGETPL
jgi:hypothetical protein